MARPLIGQVLSRMGKLSAIDIDEILAEQTFSRRPFGEIALSWGLCEPQHICDAWCSQLGDGRERLDLSRIGIDPAAVMCIPAEMARRCRVMPIRMVGDQLVVATSRLMDASESAEIAATAGREIRFVKAEQSQIDEAINAHYAQAA